ncbi:MAG: lipid II flippase MurJ [Acidobacteriota bacterium]
MALAEATERKAARWLVFQNAAIVGVFTSLTKIAAAVKVAVTARYFGASDELDAFLIAFLLPSFFVDTIAGTFTPSLVPELMRARSKQTNAEAGTANAVSLAQSGLTLVLAAMVPVMIALAILGRWALPLLGSSFSADKLDISFSLFLGMLVWLPLGACSSTWRAVLNADGHVAIASAVPLGTPVITILALFFGAARWGVVVLCVAVALGAITEFLVLAIAVRRLGYSLMPAWPGWTPEVRAIRRQYAPLLAGTMITAGCGLVDQAVAGSLGSGSVSALSYGTKFGAVLIAVGGTGMATAVLPEFSRLVSQERWQALRRAVWAHAGLALLLLIPVTAAFMWWSADVVRWMFQRGEFTATDAALVTQIQRFSLLQVPLAVTLMILQRLVTALAASPLILRAGVAAMVANVVGDMTLPRIMGVRGVALAAAIAQAVFLIGLLALLYAKEPRLFRRAEGR